MTLKFLILTFIRKSEKRFKKKELKVTIDTQINALSLCESGAKYTEISEKKRNAPSASRSIPYQNISLFMTNYYFPFFSSCAMRFHRTGMKKGFSFMLFSIIYSLCSDGKERKETTKRLALSIN